MRVRFNTELDGNLGSLIFRNLGPLDRCMARATCRDWHALIPRPVMTMDMMDSLFVDLAKYDRPKYVDALERHCYFRSDTDGCWCWRRFSNSQLHDGGVGALFKAGAASALLWYIRLFDTGYYYWKSSVWEWSLVYERIRDEILLPQFSLKSKSRSAKYFWYALQSRDATLWILRRAPLSFTEDTQTLLCECPDLGSLDETADWEKRRVGLTYLRDELKVPITFWLHVLEKLWHLALPDSDMDSMCWLIEFVRVVPRFICKHASHDFHRQVEHICGCHVPEKRQRK